jgi:hypothetical protein
MIALSAISHGLSELWAYVASRLAAWGEEQARLRQGHEGERSPDEQELALRVLMTHWF